MKAVILAGGLGTRISEESNTRPKPMIEIGGKPILWHILKIYSAHGVNDFVICCGYKGYMIKEYFANYFLHMSDVTFDMKHNRMDVHSNSAEPWRVTLVDTGEETMTGGRLRRIRSHVMDDDFCFTYGDGVGDVDISASIAFHRREGKLATLTATQPPGRFGSINLDGHSIRSFQEKPQGDGGWINGGFFVLSPKVIDLIDSDETIWEREPLERLAAQNSLNAWFHRGFWQPMDTLRDKVHLEQLWGLGHRSLEGLEVMRDFWSGKRVFVTGHTGFKGGWLALWLTDMGAEVYGYSLAPPTSPSFFDVCGLASRLAGHRIADVRDAGALEEAMTAARPQVVLHLAAQSLVRLSYRDPVSTFAVNVMGTVNVLDAVRHTPGIAAVVNVTTDKCYENREWVWAYRENEAMGGHDPYSSSKGCSELVTSAYRSSFLSAMGVQLASARAGNVIGGGDWAGDRLIPDFLRALDARETLTLRSPRATRPWQHVLEPVSGYLALARRLVEKGSIAASAWNFGPDDSDARPVEWIVKHLCERTPGSSYRVDQSPQPHEAHYLKLDSSKAKSELGWSPRWRLSEALERTLEWHQAWRRNSDMGAFSLSQIAAYEAPAPGIRMSSRFETIATPIDGVTLIRRLPLGDSRGFLERMFCREDLQPLLQGRVVEQINRTLTARRGTVRGMHFQYPPHAETKIVSCLRGEIFDVAVDLRRSSPTFLKWHGEVLSAENHRMLFIPEGFAHGFQTLTNDCELLYFHTAAYRASSESAVNALDPRLNIRWPLPVEERSARDEAHAPIAADFPGVH